MKKLFAGLIFIVLTHAVFAQQLSSKSKEIVAAYNQLQKQPDSKAYQLDYIKVFPGNSTEFIKTFESEDFSQLYNNSYQYVDAFVNLTKYYSSEIIYKSINIGKNLVWEADATGQIQHEIVGMGNSYTAIFIKAIKSLTPKDQSSLITFLADVENHQAYPEYKRLYKSIAHAGEKDLANHFIDAMHKREKQPHD